MLYFLGLISLGGSFELSSGKRKLFLKKRNPASFMLLIYINDLCHLHFNMADEPLWGLSFGNHGERMLFCGEISLFCFVD